MLARASSFTVSPGRIPEVVGALDGIRAQVAGTPGVVTSYSVWTDEGEGMSFTVYESVEAAEAARPVIANIWGGIAHLLDSGPDVREFANVERMAG